jgi:hypothetical protein
MKKLNIGASFKFAFTVYQKNFSLFLSYGAVLFAVHAGFYYLTLSREALFASLDPLSQQAITLVFSLMFIFIASIIQIFYIRMGLINYENPRTIPFGEIKLASFSLIMRFFIVQLVLVFLVMLGALLFIIPGIILILCYFFVTEVLVDQDKSARKVFRISEKLTEGVKWSLLGYAFIIVLFATPISAFNWYYFGFINPPPLWVNLIQVAYSSFLISPLISQSSVYLYKDIKKQQEEIESQTKVISTPSQADSTPTPTMNSIPNS